MLEYLFKKYHKDLIRYAAYIVNSYEDGEDIVSSSFCKLHEVIKEEREEAACTVLLWAIVKNKCLDFKKNKRRRVAIINKLEIEEISQAAEVYSGVMGRIVKELNNLRPKEKEVILLILNDEMNCVEIGKFLKKSSDTIRVLKSRALKKLKFLKPELS